MIQGRERQTLFFPMQLNMSLEQYLSVNHASVEQQVSQMRQQLKEHSEKLTEALIMDIVTTEMEKMSKNQVQELDSSLNKVR